MSERERPDCWYCGRKQPMSRHLEAQGTTHPDFVEPVASPPPASPVPPPSTTDVPAGDTYAYRDIVEAEQRGLRDGLERAAGIAEEEASRRVLGVSVLRKIAAAIRASAAQIGDGSGTSADAPTSAAPNREVHTKPDPSPLPAASDLERARECFKLADEIDDEGEVTNCDREQTEREIAKVIARVRQEERAAAREEASEQFPEQFKRGWDAACRNGMGAGRAAGVTPEMLERWAHVIDNTWNIEQPMTSLAAIVAEMRAAARERAK